MGPLTYDFFFSINISIYRSVFFSIENCCTIYLGLYLRDNIYHYLAALKNKSVTGSSFVKFDKIRDCFRCCKLQKK